MTKAVIYTRYSPRPKKGYEPESCETQEGICRHFAKGRDYEVVAAYHDKDVSGGDYDRPILWEAIDAVKKGYVLLVFKRDRLARDVLISETINKSLKAKGAKVEAVEGDIEGDGPEHELARMMIDLVAMYIRKCNAAQTSRHMKQHQANGKKVSRHPPYGQMDNPDDPSVWMPNPHEQGIINVVRTLKERDWTAYRITNHLNEHAKEEARGKEWRHKTVSKIMERL